MDLEKLIAEKELVCQDKADLFDFYHKNWDKLVEYCNQLEIENDQYLAEEYNRQQSPD